jgi:hypothetical protein
MATVATAASLEPVFYNCGVLHRSESPPEGWVLCVAASPFRPPLGVPYREHLRALHRRDPRLFADWARCADGEDLTLVGDAAETAILYDALCRVALRRGFRIGEPLAEGAVQEAERRLAASERALYANASDGWRGSPAR